jgi:hypothetical protein
VGLDQTISESFEKSDSFDDGAEQGTVSSARVGFFQRSDLNAARISLLKSSGSSHAAKWPPLSTSLK